VSQAGLADCFLRAVPGAGSSPHELDSALRAAVLRGRAAWPDLEVVETDLVEAIAVSVGGAADVVVAIGDLEIEDLYLARACATGAAAALAGFAQTCEPSITATLRQMGLAADVVDELVHEVRTKLFVGDPPKITRYGGRASLRSWVRTVTTRAAVDRMRTRDDSADGRVLDQLPDASDGPELAHLRAMYGAELKQAFEDAIASLEVRERNVLRHHFLDRLNVEEIGNLYGVHKSTAYRWLEAARTVLAKRTRAELLRRIHVPPSELDSIVRLVQSHIDLSLSRLLA
jgi:RNA polymerase sigma-70 factor (ECF subfamily)